MYLRKWLCVAKRDSSLVPAHANPASETQEIKLNPSLFFCLCAAHPVQKLCMQNCWRTCFHWSQNNVQEIAQLGFKGTRRCWVSVVHMLLQGLKWNYKFKKSHLNFPLLWAVRSFCAGPLQGGRWIRREGTGGFKVWYNEMAPTQKDGWKSFCKHFVGGLTIM